MVFIVHFLEIKVKLKIILSQTGKSELNNITCHF